MKLSEYPLIKITVAFIIGIITVRIFTFEIKLAFALFIILSLTTILLYLLKKTNFASITALLSVLLFGNIWYGLDVRQIEKLNFPFEKSYLRNVTIYGSIENIDVPRTNALTLVLTCDSVLTKQKRFNVDFKSFVKIYGKRNEINLISQKLCQGNHLCVKGIISKPRGRRNPGEFDYAKYLRNRGIVAIIKINDINKIKILSHKSRFPDYLINKIRLEINHTISTLYKGTSQALVKALILGERHDIEKSIVNDFVNSGTVHVLAVSGLHVGFIVAIFLLILGRFGIFVRSFLTIIGIVFFILISGSHPSVVRAGLMAILLIVAFLSGRDYNPLNVLAFTALIILIANPMQLFDAGFQLSFSAVLSILVFYPLFRNYIYSLKLNSLLQKLLLFISVSVSAQIGTLPFTLIYFHKLSLISIVSNIFAIPLIGLIVALAVTSLLFSVVSIQIASLYAILNTFFVNVLIVLTKMVSRFPSAYFSVYNFGIAKSIVYYVTIIAATYSLIKLGTRAKLMALTLILFNFYLYSNLFNNNLIQDNKLTVIAIDIGQGDAFIVHTPNGKNILIDAGNASKRFDNGKYVILPLVNYLEIDSLDAIFISHIDADHYRGSLSIIKENKTHLVYKPRLDLTYAKDIRYEKFLKQHNCKVNYYGRKILKNFGCRIYILNDTTNALYSTFDMNNRSGILKFVYGKTSVLFTGDLEKKGENFYTAAYGKFLNSNVLKVGHHGSKTSSSEAFLRAVSPQYAIISVGENNKFRHPNFEVLQRLNKFGIKINRTDKQGAVIFTSNGETIDFIDWK